MSDRRGDSKRSVLYARDVHQLNLVLGKFLQKSDAESVLCVNEAGHLVAHQGEMPPSNADTVAALVAGSFAASQAMAQTLGTSEYSSLIPCTDGRNVLLLPAGPHALLGVSFTDDTSVTLVRTYALEAVRRVTEILGRVFGKRRDGDEHIEEERFDSEIGGALTDVFG
ncbi:MAG: roadblock/LC7 domain-containing protein [Planctomycetota bacterium]|jgi:predicted regulator of Ras-like GTPase activity (Roadblock/LC7/MglB family)